MNKIQKSLVKKVLESLRYQLKENTDNYKQFFQNYGTILKEGIHFSFDQKEAIA
jgi:molecular chaperone HtpG